VVSTVVTDAAGVGLSRLLDPGAYDITESDSQGLNDLTGSATVTVLTGDTVQVDWANICPDGLPACDGPPPPGTVTVQKRIESPEGFEVPGARLDSFVFEVRDPDSDRVVTTLVTDSEGRASDTVPIGDYQVVEVFGPRDVEVLPGRDTLVVWTNTYPPPTGFGTVTLHKKIVWPVGLESGRAPLGGFVFEVREAGSTNAVATLVTDTMGMASVHLGYGVYDIVEIDTQEWADQMGPTQVRVTGPEVMRLEWINQRPWPDPIPALPITLGLLALLAPVSFLRRKPKVTTVDRVLGIKVESERRQ
jgi:hypothetical protein